jgi:hypothetical protein
MAVNDFLEQYLPRDWTTILMSQLKDYCDYSEIVRQLTCIRGVSMIENLTFDEIFE